MKPEMKIAVLGGTGKSGRWLVRELLDQNFTIKLLLRNPENLQIKSPFIEIIQGDARIFESVRALVESCQAVISTLGQPKGEPSIFSQATENVIRSMRDCNIKRYILTTGINVDSPLDKKGDLTKNATEWMKVNYPETTADKQKEFEILSFSYLNWTLVRLPLIELTDIRRKIKVSLEDCPGDKIGALDLAHFLIEQLSDNSYIGKAPFIASE